ncbi:H+/gluconate symporter family protein [Corynebacterium kutscheri]|uniref:H+/gluconate symporter family protein n=2 Tax=Corynebacterium kutscheri TaxID=35755 RepID=A0A0F6R3D7_9CORY|nr:H+/gluconate symporter family protein [Corynebacterium kutscheri]VEH10576.1 gluconate permease [Corynebacterium kutscheri]
MDMSTWEPTLGAAPLLAIAAAAVAVILLLIIYFKAHAFVTLIVVSVLTALAAGIPLSGVVATLTSGFGSTLASVALLVGLGAMIGRLVEQSGGAKTLADALVNRFGEDKAPFALGVASLLMGFPIFFDAGLIVMLPVIFAVARRLNGPVLTYGIPAAGAFSVMHIYLPPHPGPVAASGFFHADIGLVLLFGLIVAIPTWYVSGYRLGLYLGGKYNFKVSDMLNGPQLNEDELPKNPASPAQVIAILLLPLVLIFGNTGLTTLAANETIAKDSSWYSFFVFLGQTPIALLITLLVAIIVLGIRRGVDRSVIEKTLESSLAPICSVILITGAGGMFGGVLRTSGIGDALAAAMDGLGIPVIFACYLIAVVLRLAQGSATVALTTAAALMVPAVEAGGYSEMQLALIVLATAAGSVFGSHVNDSGFWLVGRLMDMDVPTTLRTWTVNQVLVSAVGFAIVLALYGVTFAL